MNRIILIVAKGKAAMDAARDFAADGNRVYVVSEAREAGELREGENLAVLEADPLQGDSVANAVRRVQEDCGKLDLLVVGAGEHLPGDGEVGSHDYEAMMDVIGRNADGAYRLVEAFLPLLRAGEGKRIAVLTERSSSVSYCGQTGDFAYQMSLAMVNMMEKIYFNALRPEGFTFRNLAVDSTAVVSTAVVSTAVDSDAEGTPAGGMGVKEYLEHGLCYDPDEPYIHSDENRLVMRDRLHREIPW